MSASRPAPGTLRYLCPLECGWHYDRPPAVPPITAGITPSTDAQSLSEAISSVTRQVLQREVRQAEQALREHLATHTTEQFVRTIRDLRAAVALEIGRDMLRDGLEPTLVRLVGDVNTARLLREHAHELAERLRSVLASGEGAAWDWWDAATIPASCADLIDPEVQR